MNPVRRTPGARLGHVAASAAGSLLLATALWVAAIALLATLVSRHDARIDLTATQRRTLAPQTIQLLRLLDRPVHVLAFYSDESGPRTQARLLLASYQEYTRHISWEFVDLDRQPELAQTNGVNASGTMVLQSGELKLRVPQPNEANLTGAVLRLIEQRPPRVLFLTGHGEAGMDDSSPGGLSKLAETVRRQNFQVEALALAGAPRVPTDADLVVMASPEQPLLPHERDALIAYLLRGGRLLALVEPAGSADADSLLARFGVWAQPDFVVDPSEARRNLAGPGSFRIVLGQGRNLEHAVTRGFTGAALFPLCRSLASVQPPPPGVSATRLLETAPEAWGETDYAFLVEGNPTFDPNQDLPGPLPLAYAVEVALRRFLLDPGSEERGLTGLLRDFYADSFDARDPALADTLTVGGERFVTALAEQARLVVVGDVDFVNNANLLVRGNADLFLSMVLWLTEREDRIALAPRPDTADPIVLTRRQVQTVALLGIAALPAIPLALGAFVFWRRRRWL